VYGPSHSDGGEWTRERGSYSVVLRLCQHVQTVRELWRVWNESEEACGEESELLRDLPFRRSEELRVRNQPLSGIANSLVSSLKC